MRRLEHMKKQNVDVVIGDNRTFCFDGFDNAAASILDFFWGEKKEALQSVSNVIGAHLEYLRKQLVTTSRPQNSRKKGPPAKPQKM